MYQLNWVLFKCLPTAYIDFSSFCFCYAFLFLWEGAKVVVIQNIYLFILKFFSCLNYPLNMDNKSMVMIIITYNYNNNFNKE